MRRDEIIGVLLGVDYRQVLSPAIPGIFRALLSLTYDKKEVLCWRAIEVFGILAGTAAKEQSGSARSLAQRLLWMMRDESGNNVGSAPEIIGEIVRNAPEEFSDLPPILASFHDETMLRQGVLWGLLRIAQQRPDLCGEARALAIEYAASGDAQVCATALLLACALGDTDVLGAAQKAIHDPRPVFLYGEGELQATTVAEIAQQTAAILGKGEVNA